MDECTLVFDPEEANYAIVISDNETKKTIGLLYFKLAFGESLVQLIRCLEDYPEYIKPNCSINIYHVKNGRIYIR